MENITIGNNVLVASHVTIIDNNHGSYSGNSKDVSPEVPPIQRPYSMSAISIEDNVWIGEHAVILQGVTLGEGCVIGANSVVTKSIRPYVIACGAPAKPIKIFDFKQQRWVRYEDMLKNETKTNEQV
jgi:lipopolysaccharide O-acetyltransferase